MSIGARILIVDDERIIARALERRLVGFGYEIVGIVGTGEDAIRMADEARPDLILMDIRLQGEMDGTVAAERISSKLRIPIVFLTAYSDDETLNAARLSEPFGYILKPYDERELRIVIEMALYKHAAERERERLQKVEAMGLLAGGIAHDFNNVLTVILTTCSSLTSHLPADERTHGQVALIRSVAERATRMTRQLMSLGGREHLVPVPIELGAVVTSLTPLLGHLIGDAVSLSTLISPSSRRVLATNSELEQLLLNLVVNARDAILDAGSIRIVVDDDASSVRLAVSDTGAGIAPETARRIFEPFFTTKELGEGTGLGLATVHRIVTRYGGTIDVTSEPGQGTTFTVRLPSLHSAAAEPASDHPADTTELLRGTVVVVENDDEVRVALRDVLRASGMRVLEARDGVEALSVCTAHHDEIDLVVSDVVMPRMSAAELAEKLRVVKPDAKIIYISGYPDRSVPGAHVDEVEAVLRKPFTPAALLDRVRLALRS